jgi:hypothetical protein
MNALWPSLPRWRFPAAGLLLVAIFAGLVVRFWHPHYGFTRFVQLDEADHRSGIRELREYPIFYYDGFHGYDGATYMQIAFHPLLDSPELKPALDNLAYRARRILGSALAWLLAGGDPARIAGTYAALNLGVWLALALLLWRVLPVTDARSLAAWAGVLFSAGALHAVRLALTDLLATTLAVGAIALGEAGRTRGALGVLAAAGLARETALTAVVALWRGPWLAPAAWLRRGLQAGGVALPLLLWMAYIRRQVGPADQGLANFTWPVVAWIEKWVETIAAFPRHPDFTWLITTTLLSTVALTAQAAYLLRRPRWADPWWRAGVAGVALMAMLGTAVWEGHPGAATRVLLPMGVAFAVLAVREKASRRWIVVGSLSVCSGVLALWEVPQAAREIGAGRCAGGTYVAKIAEGWYGLERDRSARWAWAATHGGVAIETAPHALPVRVRLQVRTIAPRELEVRHEGQIIFRGPVSVQRQWIDLPALAPPATGGLRLELRSPASAVPENPQAGARSLGFALYAIDVR